MENKLCCSTKNNSKKGILSGIFYGLVPHSFCIAFILFSIIGVATGTTIMGKFLLIPFFFQALIILSIVFATLSAVIYLRKLGLLSWLGVKRKWKYLSLMYSTTVIINLLIFFVVFPAVANMNNSNNLANSQNLSLMVISAQIPCSGHAPLVINELKKEKGIGSISFKMPNIFSIKYDPEITSPQIIASLEIFKTFRATIPIK